MGLNKNAILQVLELYKTSVYEKDVDKFLSIYDSSAKVFDTWGIWMFEGLEPRRPVIENWFGSLGQERVRVNFNDVNVVESNDMAILTAIGSYAAISIDNKELRSMQNRFTWAMKLVEGRWKIFHEHTSVPINNDLTAKLLRD
jgi:ketosteroid isomerase-like protein